jgi:hypothetical protein
MACNNINVCNCSFPCSHHGKCCECIDYHNRKKEFPACFFSKTIEATGDRTLSALIKDRNK